MSLKKPVEEETVQTIVANIHPRPKPKRLKRSVDKCFRQQNIFDVAPEK